MDATVWFIDDTVSAYNALMTKHTSCSYCYLRYRRRYNTPLSPVCARYSSKRPRRPPPSRPSLRKLGPRILGHSASLCCPGSHSRVGKCIRAPVLGSVIVVAAVAVESPRLPLRPLDCELTVRLSNGGNTIDPRGDPSRDPSISCPPNAAIRLARFTGENASSGRRIRRLPSEEIELLGCSDPPRDEFVPDRDAPVYNSALDPLP